MFDGNVSAQRFQHLPRSRFARNLDAATGLWELEGLLGELRQWATACRGSSQVPPAHGGGGAVPHARLRPIVLP